MDDPGFFATIYTTRALRRFKPDPIPEDVLFQLFDAAIRAPSGQNAQDWRFVVIRDRAMKEQIKIWALEGWARYQERLGDPATYDDRPRSQRLAIRSVEYLAHHLEDAGALILAMGMKGRHSTPGGSIFPAIQNLLLTARAMGLGGAVFNLGLRRDELHARLDIPDNNEIYCMIPLGYPLDRQGPVSRKPVRDVVFMDRWGERWPFAEQQPDNGWQDRWMGQ